MLEVVFSDTFSVIQIRVCDGNVSIIFNTLKPEIIIRQYKRKNNKKQDQHIQKKRKIQEINKITFK